jgi:hypothetical protein
MVDHEKGHTALHKAAAYKRRTICCMLGNNPRLIVIVIYTDSPPLLAVTVEGNVWTGERKNACQVRGGGGGL